MPLKALPPTEADDALPPTRDPEAEKPSKRGGPNPSGRRALGPYEVLSEIGRGGMGVVYKAFHPGLKRTVALKVLIAGEDASEESISRFHREAEAVAKLGHHSHIVPIYDIGQEATAGRSPLHYFAMHYVDGKSLDRQILDGELGPKRAALITQKIAEALHHAHENKIYHRDIKPANILVTREGQPQITDFGLAKDVESDPKMTASGVTLGTPQYMPPEQAEGRLTEVDARSDIYSLGAAFYEMLTGRPPFEGEAAFQVIKKMILEDPAPPRKWNRGIPRDLETICLKCLEKEASRRYPTAKALADDLGRYLEGTPILARPLGRFARGWRWVRRNKAASAGIAATSLLLTILALVTLGPGTLSIESDPPGAEVLIQGKRTGWRTPLRSRLLWPPGTRKIELALSGFDPVEKEVKVSPLASRKAVFTLVKDHGTIEVRIFPPDATVSFLIGGELKEGEAYRRDPGGRVDGKTPGGKSDSAEDAPLPVRTYRLPKGAHGIEIAAQDYETHRKTIFVTPDIVLPVEGVLVLKKGLLTVISNVKDVRMKAVRKGLTRGKRETIVFSVPEKNIQMSAGMWTLTFEKEGYWKSFRVLRLQGGGRAFVHIHMRKR
jgi:hypothetical protein